MTKLIASLGALLLFGSLGATSVGGPLSASAPLDREAYAGADLEQAVVVQAKSGSTAPVPREGEMSDEEKERRREECNTAYEACRDWCTRKKGGSPCYKECMDKMAACMKKIR